MQRSSSLVARTLANLATIVISLAVTVQPAGAITGREQEDGAHLQTGIFLSLVEDSSCLLHSGSLSALTADTTAFKDRYGGTMKAIAPADAPKAQAAE